MRLRIGLWLVVASLLAISPTASASEVSDYDRFGLWNGCLPTDLVVEGLGKDEANIGLTKEAITVAVQSRLRGARLFEADHQFTYLYVNVHVVGRAYSIHFAYNKWLEDPLSGEKGFAMTWYSGSTGTHGEDSGYILSSVSRHADRFIDEYLRVNAEFCE